MVASGQFRLSITRALGDQLADGLDELVPAPLDGAHLAVVERRPGVYQLYENDALVYVGKADTSLQQRLAKHRVKVAGRLGIGSMAFTCLYVDEDLHAVAPERLLIQRYKEQGLAQWNFNGFGSNDPGRNRDGTVFEDSHFDSLHPINLDVHCDGIEAGTYQVDTLLRKVKDDLPYLFRYQTANFHRDIEVMVNGHGPTADQLFELLGLAIGEVGPDWRITALPGYVIMYPRPGSYPSARKQYP